MFIEPIWRVKRSPRNTSGRHSERSTRKPANRPVAHAQSPMTTPPTRKRIHARRIGGASPSPSLIATGFAPPRVETSTATAPPLKSTSRAGWLRKPLKIRQLGKSSPEKQPDRPPEDPADPALYI